MNLFKKGFLRLIKVFTRYCENRKRAIYSETPDDANVIMIDRNLTEIMVIVFDVNFKHITQCS